MLIALDHESADYRLLLENLIDLEDAGFDRFRLQGLCKHSDKEKFLPEGMLQLGLVIGIMQTMLEKATKYDALVAFRQDVDEKSNLLP
jgi:hypothetical protein